MLTHTLQLVIGTCHPWFTVYYAISPENKVELQPVMHLQALSTSNNQIYECPQRYLQFLDLFDKDQKHRLDNVGRKTWRPPTSVELPQILKQTSFSLLPLKLSATVKSDMSQPWLIDILFHNLEKMLKSNYPLQFNHWHLYLVDSKSSIFTDDNPVRTIRFEELVKSIGHHMKKRGIAVSVGLIQPALDRLVSTTSNVKAESVEHVLKQSPSLRLFRSLHFTDHVHALTFHLTPRLSAHTSQSTLWRQDGLQLALKRLVRDDQSIPWVLVRLPFLSLADEHSSSKMRSEAKKLSLNTTQLPIESSDVFSILEGDPQPHMMALPSPSLDGMFQNVADEVSLEDETSLSSPSSSDSRSVICPTEDKVTALCSVFQRLDEWLIITPLKPEHEYVFRIQETTLSFSIEHKEVAMVLPVPLLSTLPPSSNPKLLSSIVHLASPLQTNAPEDNTNQLVDLPGFARSLQSRGDQLPLVEAPPAHTLRYGLTWITSSE